MRNVYWWCVAALLAGCTNTNVLTTQPDMRPAPDLSSQFPMGCTSGALDGQETDVDCGGPECPPCLAGQACKMARDCQSTFCTNKVCDPSSCTDKVKNGAETDIDCGGGTCDGCAEGQSCNDAADCKSATCTNGKCAPGPCTNGVKDGAETDVDCGGGTCPACDGGKACAGGTDCKSGKCTNNICTSNLMCMAGTADCDGNAANGCEANLNTDTKNCGACGKVCPVNAPNCSKGACLAQPACGNDCWGPTGCLTTKGHCIRWTCRPGNAGGSFCDGCGGWKEITRDMWLNGGWCADVVQKYRQVEVGRSMCANQATACCMSSLKCEGPDSAWHFFDPVAGQTYVLGPDLTNVMSVDCKHWDLQEKTGSPEA